MNSVVLYWAAMTAYCLLVVMPVAEALDGCGWHTKALFALTAALSGCGFAAAFHPEGPGEGKR